MLKQILITKDEATAHEKLTTIKRNTIPKLYVISFSVISFRRNENILAFSEMEMRNDKVTSQPRSLEGERVKSVISTNQDV